MAVTLRLKRNSIAGAVPSAASLSEGELAVNTGDGKLFVKKADGAVTQIGSSESVLIDSSASRNSASGGTLQEFVDQLFRTSESQKPTYNADGMIANVEIFSSETQTTPNRVARVDLTYDSSLQPITEEWKHYSTSDGTTVLKTVTITFTWSNGLLTNRTQVTA